MNNTYKITRDINKAFSLGDIRADTIQLWKAYPSLAREIELAAGQTEYFNYFLNHVDNHKFMAEWPEVFTSNTLLTDAQYTTIINKMFADTSNLQGYAFKLLSATAGGYSRVLSKMTGTQRQQLFRLIDDKEWLKERIRLGSFRETAAGFAAYVNSQMAGEGLTISSTSYSIATLLGYIQFRSLYRRDSFFRFYCNEYGRFETSMMFMLGEGESEPCEQELVDRYMNGPFRGTFSLTVPAFITTPALADIFLTNKAFRDTIQRETSVYVFLSILTCIRKAETGEYSNTSVNGSYTTIFDSSMDTTWGVLTDRLFDVFEEYFPCKNITSQFNSLADGGRRPDYLRRVVAINPDILRLGGDTTATAAVSAFGNTYQAALIYPSTSTSSYPLGLQSLVSNAPSLLEPFLRAYAGTRFGGYAYIRELTEVCFSVDGLEPPVTKFPASSYFTGAVITSNPAAFTEAFYSPSFRKIALWNLSFIDTALPANSPLWNHPELEQEWANVPANILAYMVQRFGATRPELKAAILLRPEAMRILGATITLAEAKANLDLFEEICNDHIALGRLVSENSARGSFIGDAQLGPMIEKDKDFWVEIFTQLPSMTLNTSMFSKNNILFGMIQSERGVQFVFANYGSVPTALKFTSTSPHSEDTIIGEQGESILPQTYNHTAYGVGTFRLTDSVGKELTLSVRNTAKSFLPTMFKQGALAGPVDVKKIIGRPFPGNLSIAYLKV